MKDHLSISSCMPFDNTSIYFDMTKLYSFTSYWQPWSKTWQLIAVLTRTKHSYKLFEHRLKDYMQITSSVGATHPRIIENVCQCEGLKLDSEFVLKSDK